MVSALGRRDAVCAAPAVPAGRRVAAAAGVGVLRRGGAGVAALAAAREVRAMTGHNSACKCDDCLNVGPIATAPPAPPVVPRALRQWMLAHRGMPRPLPAGCGHVKMTRWLCWSEVLSGCYRLQRAGWVEGRDFWVLERDRRRRAGPPQLLIPGTVTGLV